MHTLKLEKKKNGILLLGTVRLKRLPFDWRNPVGYLIAAPFQYILLENPLRYLATMLSIGAGMFLFTISMTEDGKTDLRAANDCVHTNQSSDAMFEHLSTFLRDHSNIKELSKMRQSISDFTFESKSNRLKYRISRVFAELPILFKTNLTADFMGSTITMCIAMLMIQIEIVKCIFGQILNSL